MAFNAYEYVKNIYDSKVGWHTADKAGDKAKKDEYAKNAQQFYQGLIDNGYSDVADALKNTNDVGAKYIVDSFMQKNASPPTSTTPEVKDTSSITGKINDLYGIQRSDRDTMAKKYDTLEDYNYNHNPYESDIGKAIMEKYQYQGKTASDNAVASGGASNGGNIDSYASANANRQQLAFTNAGNQAILNDFNARIGNAKDILNNLGVYQQNQDKGMQTTINQQQTEEQRKFDNDVKTSEVTGYVPESMNYSNNPFFNKDGTLINPDTTDYSQIITNARNKLKTTTDSSEKANLEATIKYATQARAYKILNMPKYSKWANTMEFTSPDETLTSKVTNKELDYNKEIEDNKLSTTKELTQAELEAQERMNNADNATNLTIADKELQAKVAEAEEDKTWSEELSDADIKGDARGFLDAYVYQSWLNDERFDVRELFESNNANLATYLENPTNSTVQPFKITKNDAAKILNLLNIESFYIGYDKDGNKIYLPASKWLDSQKWYDEYADKKDDAVDINALLK